MNRPEARPSFEIADPRPADAEGHWKRFAAATSAEEFCAAWLALQCERVGGVRSAVVVLQPADNGPFVPAASWPEGTRLHPGIAAVVERTIRDGVGVIEAAEGAEGAAPAALLAGFPVRVEGRVRCAVGMELEPRPERHVQQATRQLQWGSGWLEALLRRAATSQDAFERERAVRTVGLLAAALQRDATKGAALACVTELATLLRCERVALGLRRGGRARLEALSHTAEIDRHANLVRAIEAAMDEAIDQGATIVLPNADAKRPLLTRAHSQLVQDSETGSVLTVPLGHGERFAGALTFERGARMPFGPGVVEFCESVAAVLAPIFDLQERAADTAWQRLRRAAAAQWSRMVGPGHEGFKLASALALLAALFLVFAHGTLRITASSLVEGEVQRAVTAPFGGYVRDSPVRPGDRVAQGAVLARLDDRDLRLEHAKAASQRGQLLNQFREAMASHERAQSRIVGAQIQQIEAHIGLLEEQLARTELAAPIDGIVISGDLSQKLGAPVERGEVLFEVAPLDRYRLVLQVDEHDIDFLRIGMGGQLSLTALPGERFAFTVARLTPVTSAREGHNYYRVEARLDSDTRRLRPGMEGVSKVAAGEHRLIWVWTRAFTDWLRLWLWSLAP